MEINGNPLPYSSKEREEPHVDVEGETIKKLQNLIPELLKVKMEQSPRSEKVTYLGNSPTNLVFQMKDTPTLIFKMIHPQNYQLYPERGEEFNQQTNKRYQNTDTVQKICNALKLRKLVVPKAHTFLIEHEGVNYRFIAEETLPLGSDDIGEEQTHVFSKELNETLKQLSTLVSVVGLHDLPPRNIPVIGENQIGLIDLERINDPVKAFLGHTILNEGEPIFFDFESSLIGNAHSEEQLNLLLEEAKKIDDTNLDPFPSREVFEKALTFAKEKQLAKLSSKTEVANYYNSLSAENKSKITEKTFAKYFKFYKNKEPEGTAEQCWDYCVKAGIIK